MSIGIEEMLTSNLGQFSTITHYTRQSHSFNKLRIVDRGILRVHNISFIVNIFMWKKTATLNYGVPKTVLSTKN